MFHLTDIGSWIALRVGAFLSITAGAGQDNVQQAGPTWIDRTSPGSTGTPAFSPRSSGPYDSAVLCLAYEAVLGQGNTLSVALAVLTAADSSGTGSAVYASAASVVVATGPTGGGTVRGVVRLNLRLDLAAAGPFLKEQYTADLSAANTDTAKLTLFWVFGGSDVVPVV